MEEQGWLLSYWGESENNRRAKYYKLTGAGRRQLEAETKRWGRIAMALRERSRHPKSHGSGGKERSTQ